MICLSTLLSMQRQRAGIRICAGCDPTVPDRIEKIVIPLFVQQMGFEPSAQDDQLIGGTECDTNRRRPDACWISRNRIAFLEIDEHGHNDRQSSCETAKVIDQTLSVQKTYPDAVVAHFRFNPLEFDHHPVDLETRIQYCAADITFFLAATDDYPWRNEVPYMFYYFYPRKSHFQIEYVLKQASDAIQVLYVRNNNFIDMKHIDELRWQESNT